LGIGGATAKTVRISAIGPTPGLALFNIPGVLSNPQLTLANPGVTPSMTLASNTGWGGDPQATVISRRIGVFAVVHSSRTDEMILITPRPAVLSGEPAP